MLDVKTLLADPAAAAQALARRSPALTLDSLLALAERRRTATTQFEVLRAEQRQTSMAFGKNAKSMEDSERDAAQAELKALSARVKGLEQEMKELDEAVAAEVMLLPNLPDPACPAGSSDADNVEVRAWGSPRTEAPFALEGHDVIAERLGLVDFEAGTRVTGARFVMYRGLGARLERALMSYMLNLHTEQHGYVEMLPPFLVNRAAMTGAGQLPKFEDNAFRIESDDLFLIPTAEVPITNVHREQILDADALPIRYAAYSACFRREAGSYGRDTKGLTRLHQFQKVELVQFVPAEDSAAAHEALTGHAEAVLQGLGLPYRVMALCTGDLGFSAQRCYDLEVWLPGQQMWREISSCSNFGDFQARRADIRYRPAPGEKPRFVHTLNGSGLAIGRTVMAILEHYQAEDGSVTVPEVLRPYMGTDGLG